MRDRRAIWSLAAVVVIATLVAPAITTPAGAATNGFDAPADGSIVTTSTPAFSGTVTAGGGKLGDIISISTPGPPFRTLCQTTVTADLTWTCTATGPLPDGTHTIRGTISSGSASPLQLGPITITVDTAEPAVPPAITSPADASTTTNTRPPISGTGAAGSTITVTSGTTTVCTAPLVATDGTWSCTPDAALPLGPITLTPSATDSAGTTTPGGSVTIQITAPPTCDPNAMYVSGGPGDPIYRYDTVSGAITRTGTSPDVHLGADSTGTLWSAGAVKSTDEGTTWQPAGFTLGTVFGEFGFAFDKAGLLYSLGGRRVDPATGQVDSYTVDDGGFSGDIVFDGNDRMYRYDGTTVDVFDKLGPTRWGSRRALFANPGTPQGLAFDGTGALLVSNGSRQMNRWISPDGGQTWNKQPDVIFPADASIGDAASCAMPTRIGGVPPVTIVKTVDPPVAKEGQEVTYTVELVNDAPSPFPGFSFTDDLSDVLNDAQFNDDLSPPGGGLDPATGRLTWTGEVPASTRFKVTYSVTVRSPDTGDLLLVNTVSSAATGSSCEVCTTSTPVTVVRVTKSASPPTPVLGQPVTYTLSLRNPSTADYVGASVIDDLSGVLDDAVYHSDFSLPGAVFDEASKKLTWTGTVPANTTLSATYTVTVTDNGTGRPTGDATLTNAVTSDQPGIGCDPASPPGCGATSTPVRSVRITKMPDRTTVFPGELVTYTVTVTNTGKAAYPGVMLTDDLSAVVDDADYNDDFTPAPANRTGDVLSWTTDVPLGEPLRFTYTVRVKAPPTGDHRMPNVVVSDVPGTNCPPEPTDPDCRANALVRSYTVDKQVDKPVAYVGEKLTYTLTITNTGATDYPDASFTDDLADVVDEAVYNQDFSLPGAAYDEATKKLTWTGDLAENATATATYSVTVNQQVLGNLSLKNSASVTLPGASCLVCQATTLVPVVILTKTSAPPTPVLGQPVTYTLSMSNPSGADYVGASVVDDLADVLDDAVYPGDFSLPGADFDEATKKLTWKGTVPANTTLSATYTVMVTDNGSGRPTGNGMLTNDLDSDKAGIACLITNLDCSTTSTPVRSVRITKVPDRTTVFPGELVTYTVTVTNTGKADYPGVILTDDLSKVVDDADYNDDFTPAPANRTGDVLSWTTDVPLGEPLRFTYSVRVKAPPAGDRRMPNVVVSEVPGTNCPPETTDPECRANALVSSYTVDKSASPSVAYPGQTVTYSVIIANTGAADYPGASFTDDLSDVVDEAVYNQDFSLPGAVYDEATKKLTWTGDLAENATLTATYTVTVKNPTPGNLSMTNTASVTLPGASCGVCTTTTPVPVVRVTKTAAPPTPVLGQPVTYTLSLRNPSTADYVGAAVVDDLSGVLDDAVYHSDFSLPGALFDEQTKKLTWQGTVPANTTLSATYTVMVTDNGSGRPTGNGMLTNVLDSDKAGIACLITNLDCSTTSTPVRSVRITKVPDKTRAVPGETVIYTVTVTNTGKTAYPGVILTDDLSKVVDDADYNDDFTPAPANRTGDVLSWTTDVPLGEPLRFTYSVRVKAPPAGDRRMPNVVVSEVPGTNCPPETTDPECRANALVHSYTVDKQVDKPVAHVGEKVTYTITITNTGATDYPGASFTDDLSDVVDEAVYNQDLSLLGAAYDEATKTLTWTGDLAENATLTATYTVTVKNPSPGNLSMTNTASVTLPGASCGVCTTTTPVPVVRVTKTAAPPTPVLGQPVTYTLSLRNPSTADYVGASVVDDLSGVLDDAVYHSDFSLPGAVFDEAGKKLTWTGTVPANTTLSATYTVTVTDNGTGRPTGDATLTNAVTSDQPGIGCDPASPPGCGATSTPVRSLRITKMPDRTTVFPGELVTYTVTVTNTGKADYPGVILTDDLSAVVDDADFNDDFTPAPASRTGDVLSWTTDVALGEPLRFTYSVRVKAPPAGDHRMPNVVVAQMPGTNCPPGSTDPDCAADNGQLALVGDLRLTKTVRPAIATAGQPVTYTVSVVNAGAVAYDNATFADDLSGVLDDADLTGPPNASTGSVRVEGSSLIWTGNVGIGATETITYTVLTGARVTGDGRLDNVVSSPERGTDCPPGATRPGCRLSTPIRAFELAKAVSAPVASPGRTLTYTLTATNTGQAPYTAATPALIVDDLTGLLDDATFNGAATASRGAAPTYAAPRLTWTGDLDPGQPVTITYTVEVNQPDTGDRMLTNAATPATSGGTCAPSTNPPPTPGLALVGCAPTTTPVRALRITKSVDVTEATAGQRLTYRVSLTNDGVVDYPDASVTDDLSGVLDDATLTGDALATAGAAPMFAAPMLSWTGMVAAGATVTLTYSAIVHDGANVHDGAGVRDGGRANGDSMLVNAVVSPTDGIDCPMCTLRTPIRSLRIDKSATPAVAAPGERVTYTVSIVNTGAVDYRGISVVDDLNGVADDATLNADVAVAGPGTVDSIAPRRTWTGDLPVGAKATLTYSVTVNTPDTGDHTLTDTITSTAAGGNCPAGSADPACVITTLVRELTLTKTVDKSTVGPLEKLTYTVTMTNLGQADYTTTDPASLTDDLGGVLDDATYNSDAVASVGPAPTLDADHLTWTGPLPAHAALTIAYSVTARAPGSGDANLVNRVSTPTAGTRDCPAAPPDTASAATEPTTPPAAVQVGVCSTSTAVIPPPAPPAPPPLPATGDPTGRFAVAGTLTTATGLLVLLLLGAVSRGARRGGPPRFRLAARRTPATRPTC